MDVRKIVTIKEIIKADNLGTRCPEIVRVAVLAVIKNPAAGRQKGALTELFDIGGHIGETLMEEAVNLLKGAPTSYGKAAIVGTNGDLEHGGAIIHPKLGKPMRNAIGGGKALIPSNVKVTNVGCPIDLPLGHKDEAWSFDYFDTMTVMVADAPLPNEIVVCMAIADGGRPNPRCGTQPIID